RILRDASPSEKARAAGRAVLAGIGSFAMFVVMNPYIFLNWSGFRECIEVENRSEHAGADGLSRWGNLAWYVTEAIPSQPDGWFLLILGAIGAARYLAAGRFEHRLWILGAGLYTLEICAAHLHWERWIMPLLPVLAYLSIDTVIWLAGRLPETTRRAAIPVALAIALVSPARQTTLHEIQQICRSTRVRSLEWILANVPKGSPILVEWYSAPVRGQGYPYREVFALPEMPPVRLLHQQYRYVVTSTSISGRYLGDPARHAAEIAYYRDLRSQQLVAKFTPSRTVGGSTIEIYKLRPPS
ncbi:MAG: hypothetical protein JO317_03015, partial [Verrucomicrobiae bacterium]|nr:hypothetical protein [Verrucomicrobiae bacterium]